MTSVVESRALQDWADPDYVDAHLFRLPTGAPTDPEWWARELFGRPAPRWIRTVMGVRDLLVRPFGVSPGAGTGWPAPTVDGDEAVIVQQERHLDFRVGIAVDADTRLLQVLTVVRFRNRWGRLYFLPVRVAHGPLVQAIGRRAIARVAQTSGSRSG